MQWHYREYNNTHQFNNTVFNTTIIDINIKWNCAIYGASDADITTCGLRVNVSSPGNTTPDFSPSNIINITKVGRNEWYEINITAHLADKPTNLTTRSNIVPDLLNNNTIDIIQQLIISLN